jgi:hypothetical protein
VRSNRRMAAAGPVMYAFFLQLHSIGRWVAIAAALAAIVASVQGKAQGKPWRKGPGLAFLIAMDMQLLWGLTLYFGISPVVQVALSDMGAAMRDKTLRFYAVEHSVLMLIAVALLHIGFAKAKKLANDGPAAWQTQITFFALSLLATLAAIPWPFRAGLGRALWPGL